MELVVDGQKQKFTEAEARKLLSKSGYADKAIRQAKEAMAAIKKEREELAKERGIKDPAELLRLRGHDPDAYARGVLEQRLLAAQQTPEQREAADLRAQLTDRDAKLKELEAERVVGKRQMVARRMQVQMESQLADAAETAGLARDPDTFQAIYEAVKEAVDLGMPFDATQIVETARQNIDASFKRLEGSVMKGLKGRALVERLGRSVVDEVLRWKVEELRGGGAKKTNGATHAPAAPAKPSEYLSVEEARAKMKAMGQ